MTETTANGMQYTIVASDMIAGILSEISECTEQIRRSGDRVSKYAKDMTDSIQEGHRIDTGWLSQEIAKIAEVNNKREILMSVLRTEKGYKELVTLALTPVLVGNVRRQMWFVTQETVDSYKK